MTNQPDTGTGLWWLCVLEASTGSATRVVGALVTRGSEYHVVLAPIAGASIWADRERTSAEEWFADANGQTRGVIGADVELAGPISCYSLRTLAGIALMSAIAGGQAGPIDLVPVR